MNALCQQVFTATQLHPPVPGFSLGLLIPLWLILVLLCFVNCVRNEKLSNTSKGVWILVIFLVPAFGAVGYIVAGRHGD